MASILNVDAINNAAGTSALTVNSSGLVNMPNSVYVTRFGLTSNLTADGTLTAWSAPSLSNQISSIGTAVTVSGGLFTFPVTGVWRAHLNARVITTADGTLAAVIDITTDNGSNYTETAFASEGDGASTTNTGSIALTEYINVDDVSNVKVRFRGESIASGGYIQGQAVASGLRTWVNFERLTDAQ
jgi:hypothetical protein